MEDRVKLVVLGLSVNQMKPGAFALILAEADGPYRIPVVIGAAEAQSIAIHMERIVTPRPLTHDLFCSFAHAFKVDLVEVFIYRFEDGIFSAELTFTDGEKTVKLDSRTSDAIAVALRFNAPIYTTPDILHRAGTVLNDDAVDGEGPQMPATPQNLEEMPTERLQQELERLIAEDNYEEAAKISDILKKRKEK